jgi:hypothetical protein
MKRVLMVAYHFPPLHGSSGIQRTLKFAKFLPEFGWEPIVLSAHPRAYEQTSDDQLADIPPAVRVYRAFALDTARHLALAGRYPHSLARPDRWRSWWLGAVPAGLWITRRFAPDILWSTYPVATAHTIGGTLQRLTGLPWVADFRDPMAQDGYPRDPKTWAQFKAVEQRAVTRAARLVFATPGAQAMYRTRYPGTNPARFELIENGYDEESFVPLNGADRGPLNPGALTLLHSGIVYPKERDPSQLFVALRRMLDRGTIRADRLRVRFRASVHDDMLRRLAARSGVEALVELEPPLGYRAALEEMLRADALLVLQAANCNEQIPAKLYEYFRSRRPLLALTDAAGDTARTLRNAGCTSIAPLDDAERIAALLEAFVSDPDRATARIADEASVVRHSRRNRTAELAALLDTLA